MEICANMSAKKRMGREKRRIFITHLFESIDLCNYIFHISKRLECQNKRSITPDEYFSEFRSSVPLIQISLLPSTLINNFSPQLSILQPTAFFICPKYLLLPSPERVFPQTQIPFTFSPSNFTPHLHLFFLPENRNHCFLPRLLFPLRRCKCRH